MTLDELNVLPPEAATWQFAQCCGSERWAVAMTGRGPFGSVEELCRAADEVWWSLEGADWLEAFSHHPRIGERGAGWATEEQSGVRGAPDLTLKTLAELNREYERKFDHVFLIFATGKSADDMLAELRRRLAHDPAPELRVAAGEQAKITRLRLQKLLATPLHSSRTA